jgi:hypothetical protein
MSATAIGSGHGVIYSAGGFIDGDDSSTQREDTLESDNMLRGHTASFSALSAIELETQSDHAVGTESGAASEMDARRVPSKMARAVASVSHADTGYASGTRIDYSTQSTSQVELPAAEHVGPIGLPLDRYFEVQSRLVVIRGLTANCVYDICVRGHNVVGVGPWSPFTRFTTQRTCAMH